MLSHVTFRLYIFSLSTVRVVALVCVCLFGGAFLPWRYCQYPVVYCVRFRRRAQVARVVGALISGGAVAARRPLPAGRSQVSHPAPVPSFVVVPRRPFLRVGDTYEAFGRTVCDPYS